MKAKTYALDDIIVVVMRGSGFTPLEKTIMDSGEPERSKAASTHHDDDDVVEMRGSSLLRGSPRIVFSSGVKPLPRVATTMMSSSA